MTFTDVLGLHHVNHRAQGSALADSVRFVRRLSGLYDRAAGSTATM